MLGMPLHKTKYLHDLVTWPSLTTIRIHLIFGKLSSWQVNLVMSFVITCYNCLILEWRITKQVAMLWLQHEPWQTLIIIINPLRYNVHQCALLFYFANAKWFYLSMGKLLFHNCAPIIILSFVKYQTTYLFKGHTLPLRCKHWISTNFCKGKLWVLFTLIYVETHNLWTC